MTVTGDMGPQRYGGLAKNLGPQYLRGIAENNLRTEEKELHLVYSNNKEDIWISHIPVPVASSGAREGELKWDQGFPEALGVYSPLWAPVRTEDGCLVLRDRDPYDRAAVETALGNMRSGWVDLVFCVRQVAVGNRAAIELQDPSGKIVFQMLLDDAGRVFLRMDGRIEPFGAWEENARLHLEIRADVETARMQVRFGEQEKTIAFNASVNEIARLFIATKKQIPHLSTLDDCGKYGTKDQVLPGAGEQTELTEIRVERIAWGQTPE